MAKLKGLGRGLDALLAADDTQTQSPGGELRTLTTAQLRPGRYQPRSRMDDASIAELAESIKTQGILQPILVRSVDDGYEIIAGERRWRAAQLAGLKEVPVVLREVDDNAALAIALIENIQRENLNPLEEAVGIQRLIDEFEMTHEMVGKAVGRSRSAVSNLLRLLSLPQQVQAMLMDSRIDMGHARALLAAPAARQIELAQRIAALGLSVRETEQLVSQRVPAPKRPSKGPRKDRDIAALEESMSETLGATVSIRHRKSGSGTLSIDYSDLDQLDTILGRLRA
ncbi:MAG: chromosome partitioning protein ParB [Betaproteobacteria bacterium SG8_40]|jgi:ParB family chromosome partitioning protein|nr:MAG: chromosome partitioning protein ParB [Betaproteobacteria bacterium SG8_40]